MFRNDVFYRIGSHGTTRFTFHIHSLGPDMSGPCLGLVWACLDLDLDIFGCILICGCEIQMLLVTDKCRIRANSGNKPPLLQDLALNPRVFFAGVGILIIPIMV